MSALSSAQFGPKSPVEEQPQQSSASDSIPLPGMADTYTSSQRAAAWRKPAGISGQQSTMGTLFKPFEQKNTL